MKNKLFPRIRRSLKSPLVRSACVAAVAVFLIGIVLLNSKAAGFFGAAESEQGNLSGNAALVTDSSAAGGKAVKFNRPASGGCYLPGDGACGPYSYSQITNSNGYNTYVANQMWSCGTPGSCGPETMTAYSPGNWSVTSTQEAGNTAVLTYPDVQQLFNNWGNRGFNGSSETPISALSSLTSTYTETMNENPGTNAQAAYDIWTTSGEIMIWVDTTALRGSGGAAKIDTGTIGGKPFTYYVYGGTGGLPIIKLDTNLRSATIDVLDGLHWLQAEGVLGANDTLSQVNFGWEICSTGGVPETFEMTSYSLTAVPK
jgi:hypothetical protein